jgi:3-methylfumaryl-CoA hydratase
VSLKLEDIEVGQELPTRTHEPSNVSLFLYNAAVWNPHRIHYDSEYTTNVEGYRGIVVDGPLQGDWLCQVVTNWLGSAGRLLRFGYSNRGTAYLGDTLVSGGQVTAVDRKTRQVELTLFVRTEAGEVTTPGSATVQMDG